MSKKYFLAAAASLLMSGAAAHATPILTPPSGLTAVGDVTAVYVFADAGDTSILNELTPVAINQIFCNHPTGGCAANVAGDERDLGVQNGAMTFSLANVTTGTTFTSNTPETAGGPYHVLVTTNYADFNVGALLPGAQSALDALTAAGKSITFVGWEDLSAAQGSDFDYNDLIFAFANTRITTNVPEPLTVSLFGAGLAGAAWLRRRKSKRA
jgi:hypothetical protein